MTPDEPHPFEVACHVGAEPRCWCGHYSWDQVHISPYKEP